MSTRAESYLVGLIGDGVMPSLTPPMHERAAEVHGLRYLYRPIDLTELKLPASDIGELLIAGAKLGFNAFNVTHPCKQLVLDHLDDISPTAKAIGAVNTVVITDGKFHGHNTDASGFSRALDTGLPAANKQRVLQLGAGGAGAAVAYALLDSGTQELHIVDLDEERVNHRVQELRKNFPKASIHAATPDQVPELLAQVDGLLNATPIGMHHHPGVPLDIAALEARHWVADCIYRPVDTELIVAARNLGCQVLDGGHMAVGQAVDAFEIITGIKPDAQQVREHLLELLEKGL
ncbi:MULTISPECIES: shikimate dehydrogenase [Micrococcaceae]|uniref:shikimate dehydrogenase n=1 Tax=Micrococcaceae TaxID=1268 RepID=UPI00103578D1|nr:MULTISPECIES: shikimate dehydrogenase [Micrococcaceae]TAP28315.1 shikimate dehydrogenase [Arthrobacter sp. S41]UXN32889.1 shikimate dehydrogenase [Glutamicibacter sp. M10]